MASMWKGVLSFHLSPLHWLRGQIQVSRLAWLPSFPSPWPRLHCSIGPSASACAYHHSHKAKGVNLVRWQLSKNKASKMFSFLCCIFFYILKRIFILTYKVKVFIMASSCVCVCVIIFGGKYLKLLNSLLNVIFLEQTNLVSMLHEE